MTASVVMDLLGSVSAGQWGLLTSAQARAVGVSPPQLARLAGLGVLERVRHGVYRVAGAPPGALTELQAAWLSLDPGTPVQQRLRDPDAVVSHRSAALVHQLGDLDVPHHEFQVAVRRQTRDRATRIHRAPAGGWSGPGGQRGWTVVGGLPVTTAAVTVADLAVAGIDGGHLGGVVRDALAGGLASVAELEQALAPSAGRYGASRGSGGELLAELLAQSGVDATSGQVDDLLARRQATLLAAAVAARNAAAHRSGGQADELSDLLPLLNELAHATSGRATDPAVVQLLELVSARLAPITEGLRAGAAAAAEHPGGRGQLQVSR